MFQSISALCYQIQKTIFPLVLIPIARSDCNQVTITIWQGMDFKKIKELADKKIEKQYQLTQIKKQAKLQKKEDLKFSILISPTDQNAFIIKNLDENKVELVNSEEQTDKIMQKVQEIRSPEQALEKLWEQYLNEYEREEQEFLQACYQGTASIIKKVLRSHNPHPIDPIKTLTIEGKNGIHLATQSGSYKNIAIIELLSDFKVDINGQTTYEGRTPLMIAAIIGNELATQALLKLGAGIAIQDKEGNTALHYGYHFNRQNIIYMLLDHQAPTEIRNLLGKLPQECSIRMRHTLGDQSPTRYSKEESDLEISKKLTQVEGRITIAKRPTFRNSEEKRLSNEEITRQVKIRGAAGLQDFQKLSLLGRGAFGQVFLVKNLNDGAQYAMKRLNKSMVMRQNILRYAMTQRKILSTINHPFIMRLHFAFQNNESLFLVMDYCPGGDLLQLLKKKGTLPEKELKLYVTEIVLALDQLHKAEIIYRDLKPGNIVLTKDGHACVTDFGLSKEADITNSFCGSTAYLSPEMLWRKGHTKVLDWYLLGVLIYECLTGKPPFWNVNKEQLLANIRGGRFKPLGHQFSPQLCDLVPKLLNTNARRRLGAKGTEEIQKHKWFDGVDWEYVYQRKQKMPEIELRKGKLIKQDNFQGISDNQNLIQGWEFQKEQ